MNNDSSIWCNRTILLSGGGLLFIALAALIGPWISPYAMDAVTANQFAPPSLEHWLGTDLHGRDVLVRVLYGARISLLVGILGAGVSLAVGVCYGIVSGYLGGKVDQTMMRLVDIFYSLPRIIIIISLIAMLDEQMKNWLYQQGMENLVSSSRLFILFFALGMVEWLTMARIVRGQVLSLKERAFVQASHVLGQRNRRIMFRHLLPNLQGIILVYLTLTIPTVILAESFLSFLGLGIQAPMASWGTQLAEGAMFINPLKMYWWLIAAPAGLMALTLLCFNFLGDALRDELDPRTRKTT